MPRPLIPERRTRILDAAEELVLEHGFDAMSVQQIAERAGIAKGAVYREFASKAQILDELLTRAMERMSARSRRLLHGEEHPALSHAYRVAARVLLDDRLMTAAFTDDRGVLGSYLDTVVDDRYRVRHRAVASWISALADTGAFRREVDVEALALVLSSTTLGMLQAAERLGPVPPARLRAAIETMGELVASLETGEGRSAPA
ncbi:TetR/AcrR family transcriptional regulator [Microbacterium marinilacus]|uniref:TetR/AcrR family transcriptional regulator n=1 Tax=Microbacterium marinilacus TaxID=415209 RepID=A0ABP7BFB1_9MICO|nr:TetR/AcrR family transcriptional regulator [Microbacterium marinilacus]MBY0689011.1 TetR/AcrR family transcriptional regulator [Microbacterium marinilacus]